MAMRMTPAGPKSMGDNDMVTGWSTDNRMRWIRVGGMLFAENEDDTNLIIEGVPAPAGIVRILSSDEIKFLAVSILNWFGFSGFPELGGDEGRHPLAVIRAHLASVNEKLEEWNQRARDDEEHAPYTDMTAHLTYALDELNKLCELLGVE